MICYNLMVLTICLLAVNGYIVYKEENDQQYDQGGRPKLSDENPIEIRSVEPGESIVLDCYELHDPYTSNVFWFRDNHQPIDIHRSDKYMINGQELTILQVSHKDHGIYYCQRNSQYSYYQTFRNYIPGGDQQIIRKFEIKVKDQENIDDDEAEYDKELVEESLDYLSDIYDNVWAEVENNAEHLILQFEKIFSKLKKNNVKLLLEVQKATKNLNISKTKNRAGDRIRKQYQEMENMFRKAMLKGKAYIGEFKHNLKPVLDSAAEDIDNIFTQMPTRYDGHHEEHHHHHHHHHHKAAHHSKENDEWAHKHQMFQKLVKHMGKYITDFESWSELEKWYLLGLQMFLKHCPNVHENTTDISSLKSSFLKAAKQYHPETDIFSLGRWFDKIEKSEWLPELMKACSKWKKDSYHHHQQASFEEKISAVKEIHELAIKKGVSSPLLKDGITNLCMCV